MEQIDLIIDIISHRDLTISSLKLIVSNIENINYKTTDGATLLHYACYNIITINPHLIKILLDHKADPNIKFEKCGITPIWSLVLDGEIELVKLLIEYGATISYDEVDNDGYNIVYYASQACKNSKEMVKLVEDTIRGQSNLKEIDNKLRKVEISTDC